MNRADLLRNARKTYTVAWREFLNRVNKTPNSLFCFFEGEDNRYFIGRLEPYLAPDSEVKPFDCGGKGAVFKINDLWFKKYNSQEAVPKCLFFIDRDFDCKGSLSIHPPTYVTPAYSIENFFVTHQSARKILENEFKVYGDEDVDKCDGLEFFETMLGQFLDAANELNAWIFLQRKYESYAPQGHKCHLNKLSFSKLFRVKESGVTKLYSHASLQSDLPDSRAIDPAELARYEDWLASTDRRRVFRGKYLIEFLREVLKILREDRGTKSPTYFDKKGKVTFTLAGGNVVSALSQYATTPTCLKQFLSSELGQPLLKGPTVIKKTTQDQNA